MNHQLKDVKIGFEIGWDYYAYNLQLPTYIANNEEMGCFVSGYNEATSRQVPRQSNDRFIRKWLLLRVGAWKRNRFFDMNLKADFIKRIDNVRCPITNIELTHGTGLDSDWSVDRINNNASYACGNIVVVSTRANIAKGQFTGKEICSFAFNPDAIVPVQVEFSSNIEPLSLIEWSRWSLICSHAPVGSSAEKFVSPCIIYPPDGLRGNFATLAQMILAKKARGFDNGTYAKFLLVIDKPKREMLNKIVRKAEKMNPHSCLDIWYNNNLFNRFIDFYMTLSDDEHKNLIRVIYESREIVRVKGSNECEYHFDTDGYVN